MNKPDSLPQFNERILSERAARFRQSDKDTAARSGEEMIIFQLDTTRYGIPLRMLTELRSLQKLTALPRVSRSIVGVINVRGRIVSVYRLSGDLLESGRRDPPVPEANAGRLSARGFVLIGHGAASGVALLADDITGTRIVGPEDIRPKPISLNDKDYITGLGNDGLVYIDIDKFITSEHHYMA